MEKHDYDIGYGKPPKDTRFKPGSSGNPRGRPKGSKNLSMDLREELSERIPIREDGKQRRISKQRAVIKSLIAKALKGDTRAANSVLELVQKLFPPEDTSPDTEQLTQADQEILARFATDLIAQHTKEDNDNA